MNTVQDHILTEGDVELDEVAMHSHNQAPANMKYDSCLQILLGDENVERYVDPWDVQEVDYFLVSSSEETTDRQWE